MLVTLLASVLIVAAPMDQRLQEFCPVDHEHSRALVNRLLTRPGLAAARVSAGLEGYGTDQVRVLTDATDAQVCQAIISKYDGKLDADPKWRWTAYQVGPRYFVSARYITTNGSLRLGFSPLLILDQDFNQIAGLAM